MSEQCNEIQVSTADGVMEIRIDRPERKNALTHAMYSAIMAAMKDAEADPSVRVMLIAGTDDCFTAGNDMGDFLNNPPIGDDSPVMQLLALLPVLEKPLIAAVNGPAVGVGTTLLFHCDLVYVGESATLQMPFANLGLSPEGGSSMILPMMVGHQRAAELLMLGEPFGAGRALELGIANAIFPDGDYLARAREKALQLAAQPAASVRLTKRLLKASYLERLRSHMAEEGAEFSKRLTSPEAREAMQAFMEKRKPDFTQFD